MGRDKIRNIITSQFERYPKMQVDDLYKLCHHACMGSEHAISTEEAVREKLLRELKEMGEGPKDPIVDEISSDGRIIRVHLRPYMESGGDPDALLFAFIQTAHKFEKNKDLMNGYWGQLKEMAVGDTFPKLLVDFNKFFVQKQEEGYPAVHHSSDYEDAYRPAYRVIARAFFGNVSNVSR